MSSAPTSSDASSNRAIHPAAESAAGRSADLQPLIESNGQLRPYALPETAVEPDESARRRLVQTAEAEAFTRRLLPLLVEVFRGRRPAQQLAGWLSPGAYRDVMTLTRRAGRSRDAVPIKLGVVDGRCVRPGAVELVGRLTREARTIALALRVEWRADRWICTAIDVGPWGFAFSPPLVTTVAS